MQLCQPPLVRINVPSSLDWEISRSLASTRAKKHHVHRLLSILGKGFPCCEKQSGPAEVSRTDSSLPRLVRHVVLCCAVLCCAMPCQVPASAHRDRGVWA
eukprot:scaffold225721_cov19-Tisochrysis_lutea.AAC.2